MEGWIVTWSLALYKAHVYTEGRTENLFLWGLQVPLEKMPCQTYSECCGNRKEPGSTVVVSSVVQCKALKPVKEPVTWGRSSGLYGLEHKWKSLFCARLKFRPEFSTLFQLRVGRGPKIEIAEFLCSVIQQMLLTEALQELGLICNWHYEKCCQSEWVCRLGQIEDSCESWWLIQFSAFSLVGWARWLWQREAFPQDVTFSTAPMTVVAKITTELRIGLH